MERVDPTKGGCWYCYTTAETGDWLLSWEFDCYLHAQCLRMAVDMRDDPETEVFRNEFKEFLESGVINPALVVVGEIAPLVADIDKIKFKATECFYRNIRFLRLERKYSIRCVAELIKMSRSHAWCLETGRRKPSLEIVDRYSTMFGVPIEDLVKKILDKRDKSR